MFIRRKINASGSISIQIMHKLNGKNKIIKVIGSSKIIEEIALLHEAGLEEIKLLLGTVELSFEESKEQQFIDQFTQGIQKLSLVGPELLLGKIFDEIGFNIIEDDLFRHLVITRLVYPVSKLRTVDYLIKYKAVKLSVYSVYRYLDKLQKHQIEQVKNISLTHTLKLFGNVMNIVFYDVTTLYFEVKDEDDFKRMGFSKDGKHQQPQIVLGLLVSQNGYPLDYDLFEGNKYEGDTLIPVVEHFVAKHKPEQLVVVADAGLLSKANIKALVEKKYQYILGARIKNETKTIIAQILSLKLIDKQSVMLDNEDGSKLIISYKKARAIHDLQIRPIYHQLQRRIEAHICIAFAACKIYKELERQLKEKQIGKSPEQVIDILKTILKVEFKTPFSNKTYHELIINTEEQKLIVSNFNLKI